MPEPMFGYPTRAGAIAAMRAAGLRSREIGQLVGLRPGSVRNLEARALRPPAGTRRPRQVPIPAETFDALRPAAALRGIAPTELAARILRTVAADDLIDAVLDDRRDF